MGRSSISQRGMIKLKTSTSYRRGIGIENKNKAKRIERINAMSQHHKDYKLMCAAWDDAKVAIQYGQIAGRITDLE